MFSAGRNSISLNEILSITNEAEIVSYYLDVKSIPCVIKSPFRKDEHPSLGLYSNDGIRIHFVDMATKERGGLFDLLGRMWNCTYLQVLERIYKDICLHKSVNHSNINISHKDYNCTTCIINKSEENHTEIQSVKRPWKDYDYEYWESYGVDINLLKYCDVHPISHKIVIKGNNRFVFSADKLAYTFIENKDGITTQKIYQPYNKCGYKWSNTHDSSVIGLWTKIPQTGERLCICSSIKDALCLTSNTKIPALCIQGEGYSLKPQIIQQLKDRYKHIYICLDNDKPGIEDAKKLAKETGFQNIVLPLFDNGKDISDMYKCLGKERFIEIMTSLFNNINSTNSL